MYKIIYILNIIFKIRYSSSFNLINNLNIIGYELKYPLSLLLLYNLLIILKNDENLISKIYIQSKYNFLHI